MSSSFPRPRRLKSATSATKRNKRRVALSLRVTPRFITSFFPFWVKRNKLTSFRSSFPARGCRTARSSTYPAPGSWSGVEIRGRAGPPHDAAPRGHPGGAAPLGAAMSRIAPCGAVRGRWPGMARARGSAAGPELQPVSARDTRGQVVEICDTVGEPWGAKTRRKSSFLGPDVSVLPGLLPWVTMNRIAPCGAPGRAAGVGRHMGEGRPLAHGPRVRISDWRLPPWGATLGLWLGSWNPRKP